MVIFTRTRLLIFLIVLFFIAIAIFATIDIFKINLYSNYIDKNVYRIYDFYLIFLTILSLGLTSLIAYIAWNQLSGINKVANADFLLRIDDRLSSSLVVKAKIVIHEIYRETKIDCPHTKCTCNQCKDEHIQRIRAKIKSLGRDIRSAKEFAYLKNFLDFLETVGYFAHSGYITVEQVNSLMGDTVEYHYEIFKDWIEYRKRRDDDRAYSELRWLVEEINPRKYRSVSSHQAETTSI